MGYPLRLRCGLAAPVVARLSMAFKALRRRGLRKWRVDEGELLEAFDRHVVSLELLAEPVLWLAEFYVGSGEQRSWVPVPVREG